MLGTCKHHSKGIPRYFDVISTFKLSEIETISENAFSNLNLKYVPFANVQISIRGEKKSIIFGLL